MAIRKDHKQPQQPAQNSSKAADGEATALGLLGNALVDEVRARNAGFGCVAAWRNPGFTQRLANHSDAFAKAVEGSEGGARFTEAFAQLDGQTSPNVEGPTVSASLAKAIVDRVERSGGGDHYLVMDGDGTGYVLTRRGATPVALGFKGRSTKKAFAFRFQNDEQRARYVANWVDDQVKQIAAKQAAKAESHTIEVGQVLYTSYGFEQTNVDFYECVAVRGKLVDLRELKKLTTSDDGNWTGKASPIKGCYAGDVIRSKRPNGQNYVALTTYCVARPWDGQALSWTAYA